ncbi:MAG: M1 family metallopeptidase [Ardenticatenaceae bacterium]|nr:M1 family metallopeptidase [Ardenticatenaceae bacterium]
MKQIRLPLLLVLYLLSLLGCRETASTPTTAATATPPNATSQPNATATQTALKPIAATPTLSDALPTIDAVVDATAVATTTLPDLPDPTLFDIAWDDRSPFRAGLIPSEQAILDQLPQAAVYLLDVDIDASMTAVSGTQEIHYTNQEDVPLDRLYFHLYPNLLGGAITVNDVRVNGRSAPTNLEAANSLLNISLPAPLAPGAATTIQLSFETRVPVEDERNYSIFTYQQNILALAHFYPVIAVYDATGWDTAVPAPQGDVTYADTSFYLVRVTAPGSVVVAASGIEIATDTASNSHTYAAGPMRDFYLAASADYVPVSRQVGDVTINSYAPAIYAEGATAVLDFAEAALNSYGTRFTPYPFTELDIVSTPTQALGIEYPGIIVNALRIYDLQASSGGLPNYVRLESTTAHEVGHQWFYSLVGNDQLDEPWLDESLTQYVTYLYYLDTGGPQAAASFFSAMEGNWSAADQADIPIGLPVAAYEGNEYGAIVYGRGPIVMRQLAEIMGEATFDEFLHAYVAQFKWGLATGTDFRALAEQTCACDLEDVFVTAILPR